MTAQRDATITVREAAELLGVSKSRIFQRLAAGDLHEITPRFGPLVRLSRREVRRFAAVPHPPGNPQFRKRRRRKSRAVKS